MAPPMPFVVLSHTSSTSQRKASMSSCEPNSSTSERPRNLPDLARRAIDSFHQTSGPNLETPSIQSIMSAYQEEGQGDRELLLAILDAKRTEDERHAARDKLQFEQLKAQNLRFSQTSMEHDSETIRPTPSTSQKSPTLSRKPGKRVARSRQTSVLNSSRMSPQEIKMRRPSPQSLSPSSRPEAVTREQVRLSLEAKMARSRSKPMNPTSGAASSPSPPPSSMPQCSSSPDVPLVSISPPTRADLSSSRQTPLIGDSRTSTRVSSIHDFPSPSPVWYEARHGSSASHHLTGFPSPPIHPGSFSSPTGSSSPHSSKTSSDKSPQGGSSLARLLNN